MSSLSSINRKLHKAFNGSVSAQLKDEYLYLNGVLHNWDDIVWAGLISVNKKKYTVVNDIFFMGDDAKPVRLPTIASNKLLNERPDVLIIGGGIVGCAIARELSRYKLKIMLADKENDVAYHASGNNNGVIQPELGLHKGQLKKKYIDAGNRMYSRICRELDVPFEYTGQFLCFTNKLLKPAAIASMLFWKCRGIPVEYKNRTALRKEEPNLSQGINFALKFPTVGIVSPYELTKAYAKNAEENGVKICLNTAVVNIDVYNKRIINVLTNQGRIFPKLVINAAGVFADDIAHLAKDKTFSIHPKLGTNIILDKKFTRSVNSISFLNGYPQLNGGRIVRTIDGKLIIDANEMETHEKEDVSAENKNLKSILGPYNKIISSFSEKDIISSFTGVCAAAYEDDFIISFGRYTENIIHAAGIQSPGLTAAPAIAADISKMAADYLGADINENFNPVRVNKSDY